MVVVMMMNETNVCRLPVVVIRNHRTSCVRRRRLPRFHRLGVARFDRSHRRSPSHHRAQRLFASAALTAVAAAAEGDVVAVARRLLRDSVRPPSRLRNREVGLVTLGERSES